MTNNKYPTEEQVAWIRKQYPSGTRVELVSMNDPYTNLKAGDLGTVNHVDDIGTVFVDWDCGSGLGAAFGEDIICKAAVITATIREQILAIRDSAATNMFDAVAVQRLAFDAEYYELVNLIKTDIRAYQTFILTGDTGEK
jgi:hypothetical protein